MEGLTEREKRVMRRDDVRAEQERQMGIDILLRQADEVIKSARENEGSPEGARIERTEIRERDLQFQNCEASQIPQQFQLLVKLTGLVLQGG